jgi:hypothetical protein
MNSEKNQSGYLGKVLEHCVSQLNFRPAPPNESGITHFENETVPIMNMVLEETERKGKVSYCQDFFVEMINKLEVLALDMSSKTIIAPNNAEEVRRITGEFLDRAYRGEIKYLPYLCSGKGVPFDEREIFIIVKLVVVLYHTGDNIPRLHWYVVSEALKRNPADRETMIPMAEIESTRNT